MWAPLEWTTRAPSALTAEKEADYDRSRFDVDGETAEARECLWRQEGLTVCVDPHAPTHLLWLIFPQTLSTEGRESACPVQATQLYDSYMFICQNGDGHREHRRQPAIRSTGAGYSLVQNRSTRKRPCWIKGWHVVQK